MAALRATTMSYPSVFDDALAKADPSWHATLQQGLEAMHKADPGYLAALAADSYLPTENRIFAAFAQPLSDIRYVLFGEGPYPRAESATGVCFMDGAVGALWSAKGLSKPVNRATSLRNFMKMLLVANGKLSVESTSGDALTEIAAEANRQGSNFIQSLPELQHNLHRQGFLLLNAALVFRPRVPPPKEAKAWLPCMQAVLSALAHSSAAQPVRLVLWGKIAEQIRQIPQASGFAHISSEHPYNLSFIANSSMQELFRPMHLLERQA